MKQAYTQYYSSLAKLSKQAGISIDELIPHIDMHLFEIDGGAHRLDSMDKSILRAEYDVLSGKGHHIYLNQKCFCEWLVSQADSSDKEHLDFLSERVANEMPIVFHFPTNSGLNSYIFVRHCNYLSPEEVNALGVEYTCISRDKNPIVKYNSNMALGLGLYLKCFPECLVPGVPEDLKHPSCHKNALSYSVHISPEVRAHNGTHASPCGHFRQGHFRVLRSEWYKKKRYQVLFIDETFVNGKAHTVLSPEEVDSSSSSSESIA